MESQGDSATSLQKTRSQSVSHPSDQSVDSEEKSAPSEPAKTPEPVVVETPYVAPPINFIVISLGAKSVPANIRCRKANFIDFMKKLCNFKSDEFEMCDLQGRLVGLLELTDNQFVDGLFKAGQMYVPCELYKRVGGILIEVRPCIPNWQVHHPELAALLDNSIPGTQKGTAQSSKHTLDSKTKEVKDKFK
ncbi:uncharacterized protein LOC129926679 [Biomphalaria glabrata]|uniref:Uncharacterized protein LOC129926679 n=1 Tax=Biomphalaria glabrata TaxID=6526 RepID=A0A9W3ALI1_BIOGL|nr:uncharacterized protein LOC129926679 [Biomphalaria glabrata]